MTDYLLEEPQLRKCDECGDDSEELCVDDDYSWAYCRDCHVDIPDACHTCKYCKCKTCKQAIKDKGVHPWDATSTSM